MKGKLLSIIIPTYNMENYLHRCLDSLIVSDENMQLLEILVINDGSSDASSAIGREYAIKYPQTFRVIDKENGNNGSCINRGLREMTGKYVRLLDADDYYNTENFNRFLSILQGTDTDLVLSDMAFTYADGNKRRVSYSYDTGKVYDDSLFEKKEFVDKMKMHATTYRKAILDRVNYRQTEGIAYTDQEWIFYPMTVVDSVCYIPLEIYEYMIDRVGQTMDLNVIVRNVRHNILFVNRMMEFVKSTEFDSPAKENYIKCRLEKNLREIYKLVLLYQTDDLYSLHVRELEDLDCKIRNDSHCLYEEADGFVISKEIPLHFVRYWRKKNRRYPHVVLQLCHHLKHLDFLLKKYHLKRIR